MGINSWLAQLMDEGGDDDRAGGRKRPGLFPANAGEEEASGLNFRTAIEAHQKWKMRLHDLIDGKSVEELDPDWVSRDDQCELGQWIHGPGARQFAGQPEFADLRNNHAAFHQCAARVLSLAQSGQPARAAAEMAPGGEFARISRQVVGDLAAMFMRLQSAEGR